MLLRSSLVACALFACPLARAAAQTPAPPVPLPLPTRPAQAAAPAADSGRAVIGMVLDSVAETPLAGARVQLAPYPVRAVAPFEAVTDSAGEYRIDNVPAGEYVAGFFHPLLDSLGVEAPLLRVQVAPEGETPVDLAVPSAATLMAAHCPRAPRAPPSDSTGLLVGYVHDADTGGPLDSSTVVAIWNEIVVDQQGLRNQRKQRVAKTNAGGWYKLCGLPSEVALIARAEHGADSSGFIEIRIPTGKILKRSFGISSADSVITIAAGDSAAEAGARVRRGRAQLTGTVRSASGQPLTGAQVMLWGSGVEGKTGEGGKFALSSLPAGTQSIEVRYVGYAPKRVSVDLSSRRPASVNVVLDRNVAVLAPVTVLGKSKTNRSLTGFLERKQRGFGRFLTREDIEKTLPVRTSDVFRRLPGVTVAPTNSFGYSIHMRGGCRPVVYIDGTQVMDGSSDIDTFVQPQDIAGVEVYTGLGGAPPQYPGNGCGSVVIWTGRGVQ